MFTKSVIKLARIGMYPFHKVDCCVACIVSCISSIRCVIDQTRILKTLLQSRTFSLNSTVFLVSKYHFHSSSWSGSAPVSVDSLDNAHCDTSMVYHGI